MQAPNAQGLAGLMSRPQQQPQAPSPDKASPMAGLGSVEDRVSAYRGNPAPLQQRYAMSQDLLDLLALQKIKSEKEAAARQMQLSMGQQAAAQGAQPPTIAQQREKEVMDMTKAELAQQRGATANQQVAEQQQNMQRLMSGIARAPGAASAAQPVMMASGGIVAFAGPQGSYVGEAFRDFLRSLGIENSRYANMTGPERERLQRMFDSRHQGPDRATSAPKPAPAPEAPSRSQQAGQKAGQAIRKGSGGIRKLISEGLPRGLSRGLGVLGLALSPGEIANEDEVLAAMRGEGYGGEPYDPAKAQKVLDSFNTGMRAPAGGGRGDAIIPPLADPSAPMPQPSPGATAAPTPMPAPAPRAAAPAAPAAPAASAAPGAPAAPGGTSTEGLGALLRDKSVEMLNIDPRARQLEEESRVSGLLAFPEEQERRRRVIDEQRRMYEQEFDPERLRREGLKRALIGAGNRRRGEFAGAATAGMDYDEAQGTAKRARLKGLEEMEQGLFGLRQASVKDGIGAGQKAYEQTGQSQRAGLQAGTNIYGTDVDSRDKALGREIEMIKANLQAENNRIQREGLDFSRAQTLYVNAVNNLNKLEQKHVEDFNNTNFTLLQGEQTGTLKEAEKKQLQIAREQLRQKIAKDRNELEPVLAPIRQQLAGAGGVGMSDAEKAEVSKYLNKGQ